MNLLRRMIGDRLSGGVLAAMAGYFLILQVLMTGFACGATVPVASGPVFVLCHPGTAELGADAGTHDGGMGHDCPCVVCHAADPRLLAALPVGQDIGPAYTRFEPAPYRLDVERDPAPAPASLGLAPDPRGPPTLSV